MIQWFIRFAEFTEFNDSSAPFGKYSIVLNLPGALLESNSYDGSVVIAQVLYISYKRLW